ncbi:Sugar isomerase (SIS) [Lasiodiplodia theobromae]|uniref:Sugar isomerase (SIS) n=1 Tax=Lasiodiplodia theobromae TaxID=45133 RepID=UPI0015C2E5EB|nr:Sugar isomerase (SIS) [Lasiodiplodia theobromae]KAF4541867.1 Sugar isomerase (SIS) [Lasiodiplodia theobromae]
MSATSLLEPYGSPKSTNSDESTFDEAASTAGSSTTCADDTSASSVTPTASECDNDSNPLKRKRGLSSALTPPLSASDEDRRCDATPTTLSRALHVLATEAAALAHATRLYSTSASARAALVSAVSIVERAHAGGGKVVVCGVGKSGLVGRKTVATMKSLGLGASFLHAAEAVHGDLGDVRPGDAVLFISFSGRTAELLNVLQHLPADTPVVALTAYPDAETCPLLAGRRGDAAVLLPAPIHESEEASFGVSAPTTSTTVAMAVGDMLALTAAERIHEEDKGRVFKRNHPGGAIGARTLAEEVTTVVKTKKVCLTSVVEA